MAFWAYILRCADGRYYTGHTDGLERRIAEHETGGFCVFTARRQPVELVWSETFPTRIEALDAERRIKGWTRAKKEALIAGDWGRLHELAVARGARASTSLSTNGKIGLTETPFVLSPSTPPAASLRTGSVEARAVDAHPTP